MDDNLKKLLDLKRCFVFDFDGTLGDTERLHWQAHNEILKAEYGIEVSHERILSYLGKPEEVFLELIEKDYNISIEKKEKYSKKRAKAAIKLLLSESEPFPFIVEVLQNTFGIRLYLVSAQNKDVVFKVLKKWNLYRYFNESNSFFCDKDHPVKSDYYPIIQQQILRNPKPGSVVLFEDVDKYLDEGKKQGWITIGIDSGFGKPITTADLVIDTRKK